MRILVVEDEEIFRISLCDDLEEAGYETVSVSDGKGALCRMEKEHFDVVLSDLKLPDIDGITLLEMIKKRVSDAVVIIITAYATVQTAVKAMKLGAYDYLTKPFSTEELFLLLRRIDEYRRILKENIELKKRLKSRHSFERLVGKSKSMQEIFDLLEIISAADTTVLIIGETGVGKEMIADAIHYNSGRKKSPYVKVSCPLLSKEIIESELFGHEKGSFTGALREKRGRFELAHRGTIFLDDVDDIPLEVQVKLLRILEEQTFERVGGERKINVDIRIIAATKTDLKERVKEGKFREDLYYRLNVFPINIPPLRERKEDIPLLIEHFVRLYCAKKSLKFSSKAMGVLINYSWPGNVRELKNLIERLSLLKKGERVSISDLPAEMLLSSEVGAVISPPDVSLAAMMKNIEIEIIRKALIQADGNKTRAAGILKVPLSTLRSKMNKYNLK